MNHEPIGLTPNGLTSSEAQKKLTTLGFNELPSADRKTFFGAVIRILKEPVFGLLIAASLVYLLIGELSDAVVLFGFIGVSIGITLIQQRKSERALDALRELSSPKTWVIRDALTIQIPSRELVVGDCILINEGERISADAQLVQCSNTLVDESLLSGESVPVNKATGESVYSGSLLVRGSAVATVSATGMHTEIGKIGKSLKTIKNPDSPLQKDIQILIQRFALIGVAISVCVLLVFGLSQGQWLKGLLTAISLTMALLPEEFSVILTVFMALGVWRISRHHVLTRHAPVIETLGSITALCVDKTGTITQNKMCLQALATLQGIQTINTTCTAINESSKTLLGVAVMASDTHSFDPMEKAYKESIALLWPEHAHLLHSQQVVHEYGISPSFPAMTRIWKKDLATPDCVVAIKGAPETVMNLCNLHADDTLTIQDQIQKLSSQGLRMLGVAVAHFDRNPLHTTGEWPDSPARFAFKWLGITALQDPIRPEVPAAIAQCHTAGIRVLMITGDHELTAQSIALQAGIPSAGVLSGADIDILSEQNLRTAIQSVSIFVRIKPEQKLRIVQALQANGEIVAMTGDGVNDAPALKVAHVGISMGLRGTDVARQASSLVLLDDNFASIVNAIKQGRHIYDNLRKAVAYVIAIHIPLAGSIFVPLLFGAPPILLPIHIMFLEMIIDPTCSIVFEMEAPEGDVMQRPPRHASQRIFSHANVLLALLQGVGLMVIVLVLYLGLMASDIHQELAATLAFAALLLGNLALILSSRSKTQSFIVVMKVPNASQKWILGITVGGFGLLLMVPFLRERFRFELWDLPQTALLFLSAVLALLWFEISKKWMKKSLLAF